MTSPVLEGGVEREEHLVAGEGGVREGCVLPQTSPWQGGSRGGTQDVFQEHTAVMDKVVAPWKVPYGPQV